MLSVIVVLLLVVLRVCDTDCADVDVDCVGVDVVVGCVVDVGESGLVACALVLVVVVVCAVVLIVVGFAVVLVALFAI